MKRQLLLSSLLLVASLAAGSVIYVRSHPLIFMRSHQHCIKIAGLALDRFAEEHQGRYPVHAAGYPNALLLMEEDCLHTMTGPGHDGSGMPRKPARRLPNRIAVVSMCRD